MRQDVKCALKLINNAKRKEKKVVYNERNIPLLCSIIKKGVAKVTDPLKYGRTDLIICDNFNEKWISSIDKAIAEYKEQSKKNNSSH